MFLVLYRRLRQIAKSAVGQRVVGQAFDPVVQPAWVATVRTAAVCSFEEAAKAAGMKAAVTKSCLEFAKAKVSQVTIGSAMQIQASCC